MFYTIILTLNYKFLREQRPATNVLYQEFSFQDNEVQHEIEEGPEITGNYFSYFIYFNSNLSNAKLNIF